jgi:itaconate CoA-transferase
MINLAGEQQPPLMGVRVVAFEQSVAGPLATRMLSDLGADVLKVERPDGGDFARHWNTQAGGLSSYFVWLNRGKRSIALRTGIPGALAALRRIISNADVFVTNTFPPTAKRLGLDYPSLKGLNPKIVYCAISGYGLTGSYAERKAYDLLVQGEAGLISLTGTEDAPAKIGVSVCDIGAAMYAAQGILAGLIARERSGQGCSVDVSMFDSMIEWLGGPLTAVANGAEPPRREGMRHNMIVPYGPFRAQDGQWVNLAVEHEREWRVFCTDVIERPDLLDDSHYATNEARLNNRHQLEAIVEIAIAARDSGEWHRRLAEVGIAYGDVNDLRGVIAHPQLQSRGRFVSAEVGGVELHLIAPLLSVAGSSPVGHIPSVGEHTDEVLAEAGFDSSEVAQMRAAGAFT